MNKIKNKLLEAANRQEIHDLSSEIISKVDTSKVKLSLKPIKRKRPIIAMGGIVTALAACSIAVAVIRVSVSDSKRDDISINDNDIEDDNLTSDHSIYLADYASDIYVLTEIAMSSMNNKNSSTSGFLTDENEKTIVNCINPYINSIDSFLKKEILTFKYSEVDFNGYDSLLSVNTMDSPISLYYNETLETEKNIGEVNYKSYSTIEGEIRFNDSFSYNIEGYKRIKNGKTETNLNFFDGHNKISLKEIKSDTEVKYKFNENTNNEIYIVNYLKKDKVRFEQASFKLDFVIKDDILQAGFADGLNGELLTVAFVNNNKVYHFKNSGNDYNK